MTAGRSTFLLALAAVMGLAIAAVIAGCGVKAPPRPPLRDTQAEPAAVAPPSGGAPAAPASDTPR